MGNRTYTIDDFTVAEREHMCKLCKRTIALKYKNDTGFVLAKVTTYFDKKNNTLRAPIYAKLSGDNRRRKFDSDITRKKTMCIICHLVVTDNE